MFWLQTSWRRKSRDYELLILTQQNVTRKGRYPICMHSARELDFVVSITLNPAVYCYVYLSVIY